MGKRTEENKCDYLFLIDRDVRISLIIDMRFRCKLWIIHLIFFTATGLSSISEIVNGINLFITDTDSDGVSDVNDPFPNEPLELEKLGPSDFQPKENVGWIEVSYAYMNGQTFMPGIGF